VVKQNFGKMKLQELLKLRFKSYIYIILIMIDTSSINYDKHKKYMRDRYHRIEFNIKNKIKQPPIISIKSDKVILTFE
jgi:hypothetical protein